jgi:hypothetical protein
MLPQLSDLINFAGGDFQRILSQSQRLTDEEKKFRLLKQLFFSAGEKT